MTRNGFEGIGADTTDKETGFSGKRYGFTVNIGGLAAIGYSTPRSKLSWQTLNLRTLDQQFLLGTGHEEPLGQAVAYNDQFSRTNLWQHQLKGEYLLTQKGMKLEWMGSYSVLDRQKPDNHVFVANYAGDGKNDPSQPVDFSISSAQSYLVDGALRSWSRAGEKNFNWKADLMVPFTFTAGNIVLTNSLKGGYAGWHKDRRFWVVNTSSGYNTGDYQPLTEYFEPSLHPQGMHISLDQFGDDMHKAASLHAGYLMLDNKIGKKWRLAWGVRAEYFNINAANALEDSLFANLNAGNPGGKVFDFSAIKKREPSWNFFPSANLVYTLGKAMNLRLAYSKSIIRPDLRELSYFREYDYELGGEYVSQTPVRSTTLHHYDFRYEWYPAAGEVISLSAFYKKMQYPMEIYKLGANRVYELRNNKSAENKGLEIEMRRSLAFTGIPVVKDLTVYGNFTWLRSKVIPMSLSYTLNQDTGKIIVVVPHEGYGKEEKRPQTGASNYMINAGLYYDTKYISATLSYNYVTNRMYRPETNYWESLFERPMQGLDAQLAVRLLNRKMQVTANLSNLLNSRSLVYTNFYANPEISNGRQAPSTRDLLYQKGTDRLEYESRPGRTYSINITYRF
jgi:hypothetical protein